MKINISIEGVQRVERRLNNIHSAVKDFKKPLDEVLTDWNQKFDANYPARGGTLEQPWPPRRRFYAWPILQKTGRMRKSYKKTVKTKEGTIENKTSYAKYHQFGTTYLPIRRLIDVTEKMKKFAISTIQKYINRAINK